MPNPKSRAFSGNRTSLHQSQRTCRVITRSYASKLPSSNMVDDPLAQRRKDRTCHPRTLGNEPPPSPSYVSPPCKSSTFGGGSRTKRHSLMQLMSSRTLYNRNIHTWDSSYRLRTKSHPVPNMCLRGEKARYRLAAAFRKQHHRHRLLDCSDSLEQTRSSSYQTFGQTLRCPSSIGRNLGLENLSGLDCSGLALGLLIRTMPKVPAPGWDKT